jgi:hypothetical protein
LPLNGDRFSIAKSILLLGVFPTVRFYLYAEGPNPKVSFELEDLVNWCNIPAKTITTYLAPCATNDHFRWLPRQSWGHMTPTFAPDDILSALCVLRVQRIDLFFPPYPDDKAAVFDAIRALGRQSSGGLAKSPIRKTHDIPIGHLGTVASPSARRLAAEHVVAPARGIQRIPSQQRISGIPNVHRLYTYICLSKTISVLAPVIAVGGDRTLYKVARNQHAK